MPRVRLFGMITNPLIADGAVNQTKLKTTEHEQSLYNTTTFTLKTKTFAEYAFSNRYKRSSVGQYRRCDTTNPGDIFSTNYAGEDVWISASAGHTTYLIYRYVTASGEVFWIWILRDKISKEIISMDFASDHCSFGLPNPSLRPHPFQHEYYPAKHEIILINPTKNELREMYAKKEDSLIDVFQNEYDIDESSNPAWPTIPVTTRIKNDDWFERWITQKAVKVEKKVIPKVDYVLCKTLKKKKK